MNTVARSLIVGIIAAVASVASATVPLVSVTVTDSSGKVAYKGATDGKGTFATDKLQRGGYVVQFNSKSVPKARKYALVVSAGKKKVVADAVEGEKFSPGGVAMRIDVAAGLNITGQVAPDGMNKADAQTSSRNKSFQELDQSRLAHQLKAAQSRSQ
jgi:hypothetical protein